MTTTNIAVISFTLAFLVGIVGAARVQRQIDRAGIDSVTMTTPGARLLMRACPLALVAAACVTIGAMAATLASA